MTDTSMTSDLIERLERATEGSEALDWDILALFGNPTMDIHTCPDRMWRRLPGGGLANYRPIEFTTSIDAALSLVPDTLTTELHMRSNYCHAQIFEWRPWGKERLIADHEDPNGDAPLALCIAALRARYRDGE